MNTVKERFTPPGQHVQPGQTYGKLTVVEIDVTSTASPPLWVCLCACGTLKSVPSPALRSGNTKSCGCLRKGYEPKATPERAKAYAAWAAMKKKCNNPTDKSFHTHGQIGISYPKEWDKFEGFHKDMGDGPNNHIFSRKDTTLNFSKENCFWKVGKEPKVKTEKVDKQSQVYKGWKFPLVLSDTGEAIVDSAGQHILTLLTQHQVEVGLDLLESLLKGPKEKQKGHEKENRLMSSGVMYKGELLNPTKLCERLALEMSRVKRILQGANPEEIFVLLEAQDGKD